MITQEILEEIQELEKSVSKSYERVESVLLSRLENTEQQISVIKEDVEDKKKKIVLHEKTLAQLESKAKEEGDQLILLQDRLEKLETEFQKQVQQGNIVLEKQQTISSNIESLEKLVKSLQKSVNDLSMDIKINRNNRKDETSHSFGNENIRPKKIDLIGLIALVISILLMISAVVFGMLFWKKYQGLTANVADLMEKNAEMQQSMLMTPIPSPTPTPTPTPSPTPTEVPVTIESVISEFKMMEVDSKLIFEKTEIDTSTTPDPESTSSTDPISDPTPNSDGETKQRVLVIRSEKESSCVTVKAEEIDNSTVIKLRRLQQKLKEIDSEAVFEWYPDNPMKAYANQHGWKVEPVEYEDEAWNTAMNFFDPFQVLIFDLSDSDKNSYLVISDKDISDQLDSIKASSQTDSNFVWFSDAKIDLPEAEEVFYYLIAKEQDSAETRAKELFSK